MKLGVVGGLLAALIIVLLIVAYGKARVGQTNEHQ